MTESVGLGAQGEAVTRAAEAARTVAVVNFILEVVVVVMVVVKDKCCVLKVE